MIVAGRSNNEGHRKPGLLSGASTVAFLVATAAGIALSAGPAWANSGNGLSTTGTDGTGGQGGFDGSLANATGQNSAGNAPSGGGGAVDLTTGNGAPGGARGTPATAGATGSAGLIVTAPASISTTVGGGTGGAGSNQNQGGGGGGVGVSATANVTVTGSGAVAGGAGYAKNSANNSGGGGGVGIFSSANVTVDTDGKVTGGAGGGGLIGGGGGGGAAAIVLTGSGTVQNNGTLTGGAGGKSFASGGGDGGAGIAMLGGGTVVNGVDGVIIGGAGGAGHTSSLAPGTAPGQGGVGIEGANLSIVNAGTITGGAGGAAAIGQARAIRFTGGVNSLEIQAGSTISGNVIAFSAADTLKLGGQTDASFDVSAIGPGVQYQGFGFYEKTGASTWTLTGTTASVTPWTLSGGALQISSDSNLGDPSGGLTFSGGTLRLTSSFDLAATRAVVLDAAGGTIDTGTNSTTISQGITGAGALTKAGAGTLVLTGTSIYAGGTTIDAGTLQLGNGGASGSIAGNVTDNGALMFNRSDNLTFSGAISGGGSVIQNGAGMAILNADNPYSGATTISAGALAVGDATHGSASLSGGGPVTIASGATLGGFGSVAGSVTDDGMLAVGNALSAFASGADTTFTIGGDLTNAGLITLSGASPGNTLVVGGNYSSDDGKLELSTDLNAGGALSNQITDRLLIKGDPSTGTIVVVNGTGSGALTGVPDASGGISIIQVAGASTADAFTLAGGYVTGGTPYQYHLNAYGPGSANGAAAPAQNLVGNPSGYWDYRLQTAYVDGRAEVAPQVPTYITAPTALFNVGFQDVDSLIRRLGEIRDAGQEGEPQKGELFFRTYGGTFNYTSTRSFDDYGYNSAEDYGAVEFGGSGIAIRNDAGTLRVGLAGILGRLWLTPSAVDGASDARFNSEKLAGIATYQARRGWYLDGIVYGGLFDGTVSTAAKGEATGLNGTSLGFSLEGGWPLRLGWYKLTAEPEAQIVYQILNFGTRKDVDGINVDMGSLGQAVARLGGRLLRRFQTGDGTLVTPYLKFNLLQGFADNSRLDLSNVGFATGQYGTAIQAGGGINGTLARRFAIYGDVAYQHQIGNGGFRGWAFNGGLRYDF